MLDRSRERDQIPLRPVPEGHHPRHGGATEGQGAGLVEGDDASPPRLLQRRAALDQHAAPRGGADRRDDRHGRRDHQRARACNHQEHERPVNPRRPVAGERAAGDGDQRGERDDDRRVHRREPIDELLRWRPARLGLLDEMNDAGEHRPRGGFRDPNVEHAGAVERAGEHLVASGAVDRHRLAGDRRLVDVGVTIDHLAVDRQPLAGTHPDDIADDQRRRRDGHFDSAAQHSRLLRREVEQRPDRPSRAIEGQRLQGGADREEHDHQRALGPLAEQPGADHGDRHQHVHIDPAGAHRGDSRAHDRPAANRNGRGKKRDRQPSEAGQVIGRERGDPEHGRGRGGSQLPVSPPWRLFHTSRTGRVPQGRRVPRAVDRRANRADDVVVRTGSGAAHREDAGGEADRGLADIRQLADDALDAAGAVAAVHTGDVEDERIGGGARLPAHPVASSPSASLSVECAAATASSCST